MLVILLLAASLAATAPDQIDWNHPNNNPTRLVDGGLCVGLAWVKLLSGEVATVDHGPDFDVYRVHGLGDARWGVYSGFAAQVGPDRQHALLAKDGVTVYRAAGDGFQGYFVGEETSDHQLVEQNHFFGPVFKDAPSDAKFFERVTFGPAAKAKCESRSE